MAWNISPAGEDVFRFFEGFSHPSQRRIHESINRPAGLVDPVNHGYPLSWIQLRVQSGPGLADNSPAGEDFAFMRVEKKWISLVDISDRPVLGRMDVLFVKKAWAVRIAWVLIMSL